MDWDNTMEFMDSVVAGASKHSEHISPPKKTKKEIGLVRWRITFSASSRGGLFPNVALQVEGIRTDDGEHWTSSEVLAVELPRVIHTANTIYQLVGKVDARVSLERGMPHEFINKFTNGFPIDWKQAIAEFIDFLFQHAGRQRTAQNNQPVAPVDEQAELCETMTIDYPPSTESPACMASLSPLNSPSIHQSPSSPQTPITTRTQSPAKTPTPVRLNLENVTLRRTNKKKQAVSYNAAPTPVLNRSQRGRVIKPRLAPGERIVYDCYGSPIEARKDITRTHISNRQSDQFDAVCKTLNLGKAKSPTQIERRLSNVADRQKSCKSQSRSSAQQHKALAKMLAFDDSQDMMELDEMSLIDDDFAAQTPIQIRKPAMRRFILSDDEQDEQVKIRVKKSKCGKSSKLKTRTIQSDDEEEEEVKARPKKTRQPKATKSKKDESSGIESALDEPTAIEQSSIAETTISETLTIKVKPRGKLWNAKKKRDLEAAFHVFNPCNDKDWESVLEVLPVEWTLEEVKAQAQKMQLKPLVVVKKTRAPKKEFVEKVLTLIPNGKFPHKGTIRREALKEEVMKQLYVRRDDKQDENVLGNSLDDSDDAFLREAMQSHALQDNVRSKDTFNSYVTPSKRTYFPKAVTACRRRSSLAAIDSIGDDFSLPNKSKMDYRLKYRAQQFNRRHGMNSIREQREDDQPSVNDTSFN